MAVRTLIENGTVILTDEPVFVTVYGSKQMDDAAIITHAVDRLRKMGVRLQRGTITVDLVGWRGGLRERLASPPRRTSEERLHPTGWGLSAYAVGPQALGCRQALGPRLQAPRQAGRLGLCQRLQAGRPEARGQRP